MFRLRRLVLAILLACLPFQTVVGATGLMCAFDLAGASHASAATSPVGVAIDPERRDAGASHVRAAGERHARSDHAHAGPEAASAAIEPTHAVHDRGTSAAVTVTDTGHADGNACRFCMECCANAAPVPTIVEIRPYVAALLRLPSLASRVHATHSSDALFRPPRIASA